MIVVSIIQSTVIVFNKTVTPFTSYDCWLSASSTYLLPLANRCISYNSRRERRQLGVRGAARFILRATAAAHVKFLVEGPSQLFVPLLLLTTRTRALFFPTLQLARRAQ